MITLETNIKDFSKAVKRFSKKATGVSTERVIKKIAFDLLATMLGGLPGKANFNLETLTKSRSTMTGGKRRRYKKPGQFISGRHPVSTGRARSGWYTAMSGLQPGMAGRYNWSSRIKVNEPGAIEKGKKEGKFKDSTKGFGNKYVELINGVDYMIFLEYGSSMQAPSGVVRIAIQKNKGNLPALMNDEYLANWNTAGF